MKHTITIIFLWCLISNVSCQNKNRTEQNTSQEEQADMETKYQQVWETALDNQDFSTIEELIAKNRRFKILSESYDFNINVDTISTPLTTLFYWSLNKNNEYGKTLSRLSIDQKKISDCVLYWGGGADKMDNDQFYSINFVTYPFEKIKDTVVAKKILATYQIELDSIQKDIYWTKKQGEANLKLIQFALDKECKLNWFAATSMVCNKISLVYYFDNIATHPQYFEPDITYPPEVTSTLTENLPSRVLPPSSIKYLYNKGIDKKEFFDIVYPTLEEDDELGMDSCLPSYENEKVLIELMPEDMQKYSGRTPLHAAIDAICVADVKELVRKDRNLLNIKTVPKRGFYDYQENKPLTPLEVARFKQKQIERYVREYTSVGKTDFTYVAMLEQINKIVSFLEKETGVIPQKEKWTTLID